MISKMRGEVYQASASTGQCARIVTNARRLPRLLQEDSDAGDDLCCLLRLADLYGLAHLKQWTEQRLYAMVNPENLVTLSTHAFFCNASQLLALCVYHMKHLYGEIAHSSEYRALDPAIQELVVAGHNDRPSAADDIGK